MKKRTFLLALVLTVLVFVGYAVAAGGDAESKRDQFLGPGVQGTAFRCRLR